MIIRNALKLSVLALALGVAAGQAYAGGSTARVTQHGWGNGAAGSQSGFRNRLTIDQNGARNSAIANQFGGRNKARSRPAGATSLVLLSLARVDAS
jgi:minor curlin subunit